MQEQKIFSNITRYDEMIYGSRPVSFDEFISDKYNKVHIELFNDALKKFYNTTISNLINERFMFEFFRLLDGTYDENFENHYQKFYNKLKNDKLNYVNNVVNELSIDGENLFRKFLSITNEYLLNIKNIIIDNEVLLKNVGDIFVKLSSITDISDFRIIYYDTATYLESEEDEPEFWGHDFMSYVISKESENNTYEIHQENFFMSEAEDYVFLLENDSGTRIAYNRDGKFFLILDKAKYNNESTFDIIKYINKSNKSIINEFKDYALSLYKDNHKVIEFKGSEYWMPSSIYLISNVLPYTKKYVDLKPYWNYVQSKEDLNISDIKLTESQIKDAELVEINYIRGTAKMYSKIEDMEFEVPFGYLNKNIEVSEDYSLDLIK